jgi:ribosomal protein S27AE
MTWLAREKLRKATRERCGRCGSTEYDTRHVKRRVCGKETLILVEHPECEMAALSTMRVPYYQGPDRVAPAPQWEEIEEQFFAKKVSEQSGPVPPQQVAGGRDNDVKDQVRQLQGVPHKSGDV